MLVQKLRTRGTPLIGLVVVVLAGCGDHSSDQTNPVPRPSASRGASVAYFRAHTYLCFTPKDVKVSAGEAYDANAPRRELALRVRTAVASTYRHQIRRVQSRPIPSEKRNVVARILNSATTGISQLEADPTLLRSGRVPGFLRAHRLAVRAGLAHCLPNEYPAS